MDEEFVIDDDETIVMAERLASLTNMSVEEAIEQALRDRLASLGLNPALIHEEGGHARP